MNRLSVLSDLAVLVLVIVQAQLFKSRHGGLNGPDILGTISKDTEIYFAVVASSHLLIMIIISVARVRFFVLVLEF